MLNLFTFQKSDWRHLALALAIFLIPFQFSLLIAQPEWAGGFFNPYLSTQLHLYELFLLISASLSLREWKSLKWKMSTPLLLALTSILFLGLNSFQLPWQIMELFFLALFVLLLTEEKAQSKQIFFLKAFLLSASLQALLALFQLVFTQNPELLHQAKFSFSSMEWVRSYGSFSHPNILAAFLSLALLLLPQLKLEKKHHRVFLVLFSLGILSSFSRLGILALVFAITPFIKTKRGIWIAAAPALLILVLRPFYLGDMALIERVEGYQLALQIWQESPVFGQGLSSFTQHMDGLKNSRPWEYQPAHNTALLLLAETGVLGLTFFALLLTYAARNTQSRTSKIILLFLVITAMGDHYWLTSNVAATSVLFTLFIKKKVENPKTLLALE